MLKRSVGALFDRMWGPHGRGIDRERSDRALAQAMNEEDVEDLAGLDSSVTRSDASAEAGAEE